MTMKIRLLSLLCAVVGLTTLTASKSVAGVSFSVSVFNAPLAQCGYWVDRPGYGQCWHPAYVSSDWRPYCEGYWLWTDSGWYWVSTEQWAWATYHYGRWVDDPYYGWVWTPDTEWGPSWVSWREGDGYVGWAPLPPGASFGPDGYVVVREETLPPRAFVFVEVGHFAEPIHRRAVIVNNITIINKTVNITKITRVNNVVVNNGPQRQEIEKVSSRELTVPPPRVAAGRPNVDQSRETPEKINPAPRRETPEAADERDRMELEKQSANPQPAEKPRVAPPPAEKQPPRDESHKDEKQEHKDEKENKSEPGGN